MTTEPVSVTVDPKDRDSESLTSFGAPRCTATNRAGARCGKPAMKGQRVCRSHGGASPQAMAKAQQRQAAASALVAVQTLGLPLDVTPTEALLNELRWTAGHVEWLRQKLQAEGEVPVDQSAYYYLYTKERDHLVKVGAAAVKAGVEERRIEIEEQQAMLIADVLRRILDAVLGQLLERGLDPRVFWDPMLEVIVPRELRALSAGRTE